MAHTAQELLTLVVRGAEQRGLPDNTVYSIGFWVAPNENDDSPFATPQFNAQLKLTLGEIREAIR